MAHTCCECSRLAGWGAKDRKTGFLKDLVRAQTVLNDAEEELGIVSRQKDRYKKKVEALLPDGYWSNGEGTIYRKDWRGTCKQVPELSKKYYGPKAHEWQGIREEYLDALDEMTDAARRLDSVKETIDIERGRDAVDRSTGRKYYC